MPVPPPCWCRRPPTATPPRPRSTSCSSPIAPPQERASFPRRRRSAACGPVIGVGEENPPSRIVLFSDGKETVPSNPDNPKGAFTAARTAKDQGVPISTISFGTPYGYVEINGQRQPVPVDDATLRKVAELSGGTAYKASNVAELKNVYASLQQQVGYETIKGDAGVRWLRLGA